MENKPFALIGINTNRYKPEKLKEVMDKEKLNCAGLPIPTTSLVTAAPFACGSQGTPTLFVLDHKGIIRYRWLGSPGEKKIDEALGKTHQGSGRRQQEGIPLTHPANGGGPFGPAVRLRFSQHVWSRAAQEARAFVGFFQRSAIPPLSSSKLSVTEMCSA